MEIIKALTKTWVFAIDLTNTKSKNDYVYDKVPLNNKRITFHTYMHTATPNQTFETAPLFRMMDLLRQGSEFQLSLSEGFLNVA